MGRHNVYAALYAFAVGVLMHLELPLILRGLGTFKPVGMRQNIYNIGELTVIEDCYNASPESMRAALQVLRDLSAGKERGGRMAALLGDMYELGDTADALHEGVGREFARVGGSLLFTFGASADHIAQGAILGGTAIESIYRNGDVRAPELSGEMLLHALRAGDTLLVKASRGARAERVLEYLKANADRLCRV